MHHAEMALVFPPSFSTSLSRHKTMGRHAKLLMGKCALSAAPTQRRAQLPAKAHGKWQLSATQHATMALATLKSSTISQSQRNTAGQTVHQLTDHSAL
jgi:hypothetical protein